MAIADRNGIPVGVSVGSASPHEVKLVEEVLDSCLAIGKPRKLIGDKAYDSDGLDKKLWEERHIELIAPHKQNRRKPATQDGRKLRRYSRRWKVERVFAWFQNFRRILVRHEYKLQNYLGFVQLGVMRILLRQF